jgi:hypothetical protein
MVTLLTNLINDSYDARIRVKVVVGFKFTAIRQKSTELQKIFQNRGKTAKIISESVRLSDLRHSLIL